MDEITTDFTWKALHSLHTSWLITVSIFSFWSNINLQHMMYQLQFQRKLKLALFWKLTIWGLVLTWKKKNKTKAPKYVYLFSAKWRVIQCTGNFIFLTFLVVMLYMVQVLTCKAASASSKAGLAASNFSSAMALSTVMLSTIAWALSFTFWTSPFTFSAACAFTVTSFNTYNGRKPTCQS